MANRHGAPVRGLERDSSGGREREPRDDVTAQTREREGTGHSEARHANRIGRGEQDAGQEVEHMAAGEGLGSGSRGGLDVQIDRPPRCSVWGAGPEVSHPRSEEVAVHADPTATPQTVGDPDAPVIVQTDQEVVGCEARREAGARGDAKREPVLVSGAQRERLRARRQSHGGFERVVARRALKGVRRADISPGPLDGEAVRHRRARASRDDDLRRTNEHIGGQEHGLDAEATVAEPEPLDTRRERGEFKREIPLAWIVAEGDAKALSGVWLHEEVVGCPVAEQEARIRPGRQRRHGVLAFEPVARTARGGSTEVVIATDAVARAARGAVADAKVLALAGLTRFAGLAIVVNEAADARAAPDVTDRRASRAVGVVYTPTVQDAGPDGRADLEPEAVPVGVARGWSAGRADLVDAGDRAVGVLDAVGQETLAIEAALTFAQAVAVLNAARGLKATPRGQLAGLCARAVGVSCAAALAGATDAEPVRPAVLVAGADGGGGQGDRWACAEGDLDNDEIRAGVEAKATQARRAPVGGGLTRGLARGVSAGFANREDRRARRDEIDHGSGRQAELQEDVAVGADAAAEHEPPRRDAPWQELWPPGCEDQRVLASGDLGGRAEVDAEPHARSGRGLEAPNLDKMATALGDVRRQLLAVVRDVDARELAAVRVGQGHLDLLTGRQGRGPQREVGAGGQVEGQEVAIPGADLELGLAEADGAGVGGVVIAQDPLQRIGDAETGRETLDGHAVGDGAAGSTLDTQDRRAENRRIGEADDLQALMKIAPHEDRRHGEWIGERDRQITRGGIVSHEDAHALAGRHREIVEILVSVAEDEARIGPRREGDGHLISVEAVAFAGCRSALAGDAGPVAGAVVVVRAVPAQVADSRVADLGPGAVLVAQAAEAPTVEGIAERRPDGAVRVPFAREVERADAESGADERGGAGGARSASSGRCGGANLVDTRCLAGSRARGRAVLVLHTIGAETGRVESAEEEPAAVQIVRASSGAQAATGRQFAGPRRAAVGVGVARRVALTGVAQGVGAVGVIEADVWGHADTVEEIAALETLAGGGLVAGVATTPERAQPEVVAVRDHKTLGRLWAKARDDIAASRAFAGAVVETSRRARASVTDAVLQAVGDPFAAFTFDTQRTRGVADEQARARCVGPTCCLADPISAGAPCVAVVRRDAGRGLWAVAIDAGPCARAVAVLGAVDGRDAGADSEVADEFASAVNIHQAGRGAGPAGADSRVVAVLRSETDGRLDTQPLHAGTRARAVGVEATRSGWAAEIGTRRRGVRGGGAFVGRGSVGRGLVGRSPVGHGSGV